MGNAAHGATTVVEVRNVSKRYGASGRKRSEASVTQALDRVSFAVAEGEFAAIMGPSGSGKSTLLNCLATIDAPSSGQIVIGGRTVTDLRGRQLSDFRRDDLGFIFQDANLLDTLTAYENIALALTIQHVSAREIDGRVREAARVLGIEDVLDKRPFQMSGGQRQRVAAARATVTRPHLVLADEPTAHSTPGRRPRCSNRSNRSTRAEPPSSWSRTMRCRRAIADASSSSRTAVSSGSCAVAARTGRRFATASSR